MVLARGFDPRSALFSLPCRREHKRVVCGTFAANLSLTAPIPEQLLKGSGMILGYARVL